MNDLGIALLWCAAQVTLVSAAGVLLCLAARRLRSTVGSTVALTTLVLAVVLTVLAASPWPRWRLSADLTPPRPTIATNASRSDSPAPSAAPIVTGDWRASATDFVRALQDELTHRPAPDQAANGWRWPAVMAILFLAGTICGLFRLLLGMRAIQSLRRRCPAITDPCMRELAEVLQAELGCRRAVELRESPRFGTAATFGWWQPLILLPGDWRDWTDAERRAVLAHELAHIQRNDFVSSLAAQVGVVLHFYHPLMHWLAGRLRLEQELAADACAARLAGGSREYLTTLASMALRRDACSPGWPARTFLPTRGALLRRIEMLRDPPPSLPNRSWTRRLAVCGLLAAIALIAAGLRPPGHLGLSAALGQPSPQDKPAADDEQTTAAAGIDLSFVPGEACLVLAIRPAMLLQAPDRSGLAETLNEQAGIEDMLGLPLQQVEQVTLVALRGGQQPGGPPQLPQPRGQIFRAVEPFDWTKLAAVSVPDPVEVRYAGQVYYKSTTMPGNIGFYRPDDRTIIIDEEANLYRYILRAQGLPGEFAWSGIWDQVVGGVAAAAIDVGCVRGVFNDAVLQQPQQAPFAAFAPLWEETTAMVAGATIDEKLHAKIVVASPNDDGRAKVADTAQALLTLAGNMAKNMRKQAAAAPGADGAAAVPFLDLAIGLLSTAKVERAGADVRATATSDRDASRIITVMIPAISAAREAARRAQAMNNLKQLALAMHNYASVHGSFPPAVLYSPSNVPYSWRVAVLPYIEQEALYRQYNFDEPWDSASNRKILDQMPAVFRDAGADAASKNSSYFVLTGAEAIFGDRTGTGFQHILDGTSYTLLMVEAQRDIPWTKPEDIPYASNQPLPQLGGLRPGGFNAALADGSVRFISQSVEEAVLRALISKAGGEVVDLNP